MIDIRTGDCLEVLRTLQDNSVDSIVTDPPYGLRFMGKRWDYDVPGVDVWAECLRVLKPGGHLLAFAGTRTQHRMATRIEDAGFEIRDMIAWVYGSGFPKSLDVSKAIDKMAEREVVGKKDGNLLAVAPGQDNDRSATTLDITAPATEAARQWQGWGTALKPSLEPVTVARKPLIGTVAENVLAHGTGALNIDGCRIETTENLNGGAYAKEGGRTESQSLHGGTGMNQPGKTVGREFEQPAGRWPANLIHDGSDEVLAAFPDAPGQQGDLKGHSRDRISKGIYGDMKAACDAVARGDIGSAARFFYCAKASREDRNDGCDGMERRLGPEAGGSRASEAGRRGGYGAPRENHHPTVKPTALMRYLCRLVTPTGGIVLDPFMGSGSTGKAAALEGFGFIGIDINPEYSAIAERRIGAVVVQGSLFS